MAGHQAPRERVDRYAVGESDVKLLPASQLVEELVGRERQVGGEQSPRLREHGAEVHRAPGHVIPPLALHLAQRLPDDRAEKFARLAVAVP